MSIRPGGAAGSAGSSVASAGPNAFTGTQDFSGATITGLSGVGRLPSGYRYGRIYSTAFTSATIDALFLDQTNVTYTTEDSKPCIAPTAAGTPMECYTKDLSWTNCEIKIQWKAKTDTPYTIGNQIPLTFLRRLGANDYYRLQIQMNTALANFAVKVTAAGSDLATSGTATSTVDVTNATAWRTTVFQVFEDIVRFKTWVEGGTEGGWYSVRLNSSASATTDNPPNGGAGIYHQYGTRVRFFQVSEMVKNSNNLLVTASPSIPSLDATPIPLPWVEVVGGTTTNTITSATDQYGETRNVFQVSASTTAKTGGWEHDIWNTRHRGLGVTARPTRRVAYPECDFPRAIEVSLWTKGTSIVAAGTLAATIVTYYYAYDGTILNTLPADGSSYYHTLGPNGVVGSAVTGSGNNGSGTWGWTETKWRMNLSAPERIAYAQPKILFHDACTGTLQFTDVYYKPIY